MTDYTENFERFWKIYPRRNGKKVGKFDAFKVWKTLSADDRIAAYSEVEKRNRYKAWDFVKDAHRWLKGRGWDDECESPQQDLVAPRPIDQPDQATDMRWPQVLFGRLHFAYVINTPLPDYGQRAMKVRDQMVNEFVPAMLEDIEAEEMTIAEACAELAPLFLKRLDEAYDRDQCDSVLRAAKRQRWNR